MVDVLEQFKHRTIIEVRHYRNEKIRQFLESIPNDGDRHIAVKTIDFLKKEYPVLEQILRGQLIGMSKEEE